MLHNNNLPIKLIKSNNTFVFYRAYKLLKDRFMVLKIGAKIIL